MPKDTKPSKPANATKPSIKPNRVTCTMKASAFGDALRAANKARGRMLGMSQYTMTQFCWRPTNGALRVTATDGHRIHSQSVLTVTPSNGKSDVRCIVRDRGVRMMLEAMSNAPRKDHSTVSLTLDQTADKYTVTLRSEPDEFSLTYSQPAEGLRFPDCDALLAERRDLLCDVDRLVLLKAMRDYAAKGYTEACDRAVPVVISTLIASGTLVYETGWSTKNAQEVWKIPKAHIHSDSRIWLNPQYLIDALTCCKSDVVTLAADSKHSAVELYDRHNPSSAEHGYKRFVALIAAIRPPEK